MNSKEPLNHLIKKRIIITIFAIIATVTSAVLISIILPKKGEKMPKMPGLTPFDSVSGVFSFDYPTFFEKIREHWSAKGFFANVGVDLLTNDILEKTEMILKGKGFMLIFIMPISDESISIKEDLYSAADNHKDWLTVVEIMSKLGKYYEDFFYIERRIRTRIIGIKYYDIFRIQTSDGFHIMAWASIKNKNWKDYKEEIQESFKSIEFFPSRARELLERLQDKSPKTLASLD